MLYYAYLGRLCKVLVGYTHAMPIYDKLYTCAFALDIKKAFDSVNHSILLNKLSHYGIRGVCHQLFESYLLNRKQYVCMNDANSPMQEIKSGSVLISFGTNTLPIIHK